LADLIEQRVELRNELGILTQRHALARNAGTDYRWPDDPPPSVAAGLPASLLAARPILRAAGLRLREHWLKLMRRAELLPLLDSDGSLGTAARGLSELVSNPLGSLAPFLAAPFVTNQR